MKTSTSSLVLVIALLAACKGDDGSITLLNASYDPTRELWRDLNEAFVADYQAQTGRRVTIDQSHGGSSSQARAVIDGLEADVVTLASFLDTDAIRQAGLIDDGWVDELPHRSLPYTSTIVFVVRKGNPEKIADWPDLVAPGVEVITPNPKTSGNGYLSFFAAWGSVVVRGGTEAEARAYVKELYGHVPVLDSAARAAAATFVHKQIGVVHLAWENEAYLEVAEAGGELELVYPPISILAEPHIAVVDDNVDERGTRVVAQAYLEFAYTPAAQEIVAKHHYRPSDDAVMQRHASALPPMRRFAITEIAASFPDAHAKLIGEGGVFDSIYVPR